jgi:hypothetical protein
MTKVGGVSDRRSYLSLIVSPAGRTSPYHDIWTISVAAMKGLLGAPGCEIFCKISEGEGLALRDLPRKFLTSINREDAIQLLDKYEINNLWLPLPKHNLRHLLKASEDESRFIDFQQSSLLGSWPSSPLPANWHVAFEDGDDQMVSKRILGEGGFGLVDQVVLSTQPEPTVCVRKRIGRPNKVNSQKKLFEAFRR